MEKNYLQSKASKKKSALGAVWIIVVLAIIFIYVVVKFAAGNLFQGATSGGLPTGEQAYEVAQDFVKSTVRSGNVDFPSSGYGIAKKSDSIYIIRSSAELEGDNDKKTTHFRVMMQYKGGKQTSMKSWDLLNISEE